MEGKHYEDRGDLNLVLTGNQLLVVCSAGSHAWVAELKPVGETSGQDRAQVAEAVRGVALDMSDVDREALLNTLQE